MFKGRLNKAVLNELKIIRMSFFDKKLSVFEKKILTYGAAYLEEDSIFPKLTINIKGKE